MTYRPRGAFGVDAPWVPVMWIGLTALTAAIAVAFGLWRAGWWTEALGWYFAACAVIYLIGAGLYWHASLRGKFLVWRRLLAAIPPADVAHALDLGCGRGAVAIMTALSFPRADVTGIDIWRVADQSGNSERAANANVRANGVESRIVLITGDMTSLPFRDGSFDLVTASLSIHNIPSKEGRAAALRESARVLAPGGRLIIVDIRRTRDYADELARLGLAVTGPTGLGWGSWWTGPWMAASVVQAIR